MNYFDSFTLYLDVDKDLADNTIQSYLRDLRNFDSFLGDRPLTGASKDDVRAFVANLSERGRKRSTIARVVFSLKSYYNFLVGIEEVLSVSPVTDIKIANKEKALPKAISPTDVSKIIAVASSSLRNHLLIELFYGLGGRVSEIVKIRIEDIDFDGQFIKLFGKGNKERINPIHPSCLTLIRKFMVDKGISEGYLFKHSRDPNRHMTRENAFIIVKRLAKLAGIEPSSLSPHVFRHTYATTLVRNGCDMSVVQELLGHEDISTTKIYAKLDTNSKADSFKKFHPLA